MKWPRLRVPYFFSNPPPRPEVPDRKRWREKEKAREKLELSLQRDVVVTGQVSSAIRATLVSNMMDIARRSASDAPPKV